ncbi:alpha-L-rhamnosidase [Sphingobacterium olei]|uniref:alpha-L-rhamnosidase n=1 Tax=Sphingobacterium olei TaxID=2571155 RepID=A0A4U0P707_9SPHI|nr:alpha-L-rhamnosidase [Sphingobacterium olei]TJZ63233.1 alpha-L-rhamnosidase [Sphingobacterium olei]
MRTIFLFGLLALITFFSYLPAYAQKIDLFDLKVEHQSNPLCIETTAPRMSWKLRTELNNTSQKSYEIRIGTDPKGIMSNKNIVWRDFKNTAQSVLIPYEGPALKSGNRYYWQVRITDNHNNTSAWSEVQTWQMGIGTSDWTAKWIALPFPDTTKTSPLFRKTYSLNKNIKSATAYISARGLYEAYINGQRIGDAYFMPGWTSYKHHIQYQTYDVTKLLKKGNNVLAAMLGDGWYKGRIGFNDQKEFYGDTRALLLQIEVLYADGSKQILSTDDQWKTALGPVLASDIYDGEIYDARLEKNGWTLPEYTESADWQPVRLMDYSYEGLIGINSPPVKKQEHFKVKSISRTPRGELIVDFGQNLVGWVELKAKGASGTKITLNHAEVLDKEGNFYTTNLRTAKQQNIYILKGTEQVFSPHFSFQGFRYLKVEGYPGELAPEDLTAVALYSDMPQTGTFETSNPLLNQLQHNIVWGQKGNFVDVPTDCPQRDERLGWTGDAQAFFNTAAFNMDVSGFFIKWLRDIRADQHTNGSIPFVIPDVLRSNDAGAAGWGDVATIVPWGIFYAYGDTRILEDQYNSMQAWVDFITSKSQKHLWNTGFHFGDWLFYRPDDDNDGRAAVTDKYLIAQCFYAHSTQLLANAAGVLGKTKDEEKYKAQLERIKHAFQQEYLTPNGRLVSSTQTAYVLALQFDMLPENLRQQAANRLVENIRSYGNHLTTGFLGTPYLCHVLTRFGHTETAYDLLLQETYPSWLYPVKMGATTIWERWDGIKPNGTFQTPSMNSYNHYAYGAIGDWMYKNMAGINPDEVGYKKIKIEPRLGRGITTTSASLDTPYGIVSSSWTLENGIFKLSVSIPPNTTATVIMPARITNTMEEQGNEKIIGSGSYYFESKIE